jgi:hypothetical protein
MIPRPQCFSCSFGIDETCSGCYIGMCLRDDPRPECLQQDEEAKA